MQKLQNVLNNLGCNCGEADGCFGYQTEDCVMNFQVTSNITYDPLGTVGVNTWNAINNGTGSCSINIDFGDYYKSETTHCCIPKNLPDNPFTVCLDSNEDCSEPLSLPLEWYYPSEGSCDEGLNASLCGKGCCVPTDNTQPCYDTSGGGCSTTPDIRIGELCSDIRECYFNICTGGTNDCYYQRGDCDSGDTFTGYFSSTEADALWKISQIPECNYGTCAVENEDLVEGPGEDWRICSWVSKNDCETKSGDFFYNIQVEIVTYGATTAYKIPDTNIYCANY